MGVGKAPVFLDNRPESATVGHIIQSSLYLPRSLGNENTPKIPRDESRDSTTVEVYKMYNVQWIIYYIFLFQEK